MRIPELNIIHPGRVASISVHFSDQQNAVYHLCIAQKTNGKIEITFKANNLSSLEQVFEHLPKSVPVLLNITGKVVLNKHYRQGENESLAEQHIPANQKADFYCYEHQLGEYAGLSLCRKSIIDQLTKSFKDKGADIVGLSLGPFVVVNLWQMELTKESAIHVPQGKVSYSADRGEFDYTTSKDEAASIIIGEENLSETEIIPFTQAISWFLKLNNDSFYGDDPDNVIAEYQYKRIVHQLKFPALGLILAILMLNYFMFESYRKKEILLEGQLNMNAGLITRLDSLESQLKAKEKYIAIIGENRSHYSLLLDQIAITVPSKIILQRVDINPLVKKVKAGEAVEIDKEIRIAGLSSTSLVLNEWTKALAKKDWVKDVVVLNYHKNTDNIKGEFLVKILLKE